MSCEGKRKKFRKKFKKKEQVVHSCRPPYRVRSSSKLGSRSVHQGPEGNGLKGGFQKRRQENPSERHHELVEGESTQVQTFKTGSKEDMSQPV